jgi:iron complex outermembrane receptor protein
VPASVSLGLLRDLPWGMVASVTGQYTERAPEALELFAKGSHDAPGTFEIGDSNLKKEANTSIEIGLRRPKGSLRFDATAYYSHYQGFISKRLNGIRCGAEFDTCGVKTELRQIVYTQRDASFTGAELSAQLDVASLARGMFGVDGQYDFVRARFDDGTNVPRIPPHRLGGGVFWRDANWFARVGLLHAFAQDETAPEETRTPGYHLLRAEISYTKKFTNPFGLREVTVGLVGTNLLDDDVRNHDSFRKDEVLLAGRGIRFFTTVKF